MKRYVSGFLFFFFLTAVALLGLFYVTREMEREETRRVRAVENVENVEFPGFADIQPETETMVHVVLNQNDIIADVEEQKYCLVAEEGYLIVYDQDEETVNLFTHMPLSEFPVSEQEKLLKGIWFSTIAEIFSYLESYSS